MAEASAAASDPTGAVQLRILDRQQLFEESADLPFAIDEMNLQNPMSLGALRIRLAQQQRIATAN